MGRYKYWLFYVLGWLLPPLALWLAWVYVTYFRPSSELYYAAGWDLLTLISSDIFHVGVRPPLVAGGLIWTSLIVIVWVIVGDGSESHKKYFDGKKAVFISFTLVSLLILVANLLSYSHLSNAVQGARAERAVLQQLVEQVNQDVTTGEDIVRIVASDARREENSSKIETIAQANNPAGWIAPQDAMLRLDSIIFQIELLAEQGATLGQTLSANSALASENEGPQQALQKRWSDSYRVTADHMKQLAARVGPLRAAHDRFGDALNATEETERERDALAALWQLESEFVLAKKLADGAKTSLAASSIDVISPFILITALYAVFLLFPCVLLFQFLIQKREYLVGEKAQTLLELKLAEKFLRRSPNPEVRKNASLIKKAQEGNKKLPDDVMKALTDEINAQAFGGHEYAVSISVLTAFTATLWYQFFYPQAATGLAWLIADTGGVQAFAGYLVRNASPITFGFIGAYFYTVQMLLRRFFAADLNPHAYVNAVVRLLTVFVLSVVLQLLVLDRVNGPGPLDFTVTQESMAAAAFIAGIFPAAALQWMIRLIKRLIPWGNAPESMDRFPPTRLDGLNSWHEMRLLEEKVENVQNLATASLDDLIIHTNFAPAQLVDWIDQALLFIHAQDRWIDTFHSVGIRTATDLLDVARSQSKHAFLENEFDEVAAGELATAMNIARSYNGSDVVSPQVALKYAEVELNRTVADTVIATERAVELAETFFTIDPASNGASAGPIAESSAPIELTPGASKMAVDANHALPVVAPGQNDTSLLATADSAGLNLLLELQSGIEQIAALAEEAKVRLEAVRQAAEDVQATGIPMPIVIEQIAKAMPFFVGFSEIAQESRIRLLALRPAMGEQPQPHQAESSPSEMQELLNELKESAAEVRRRAEGITVALRKVVTSPLITVDILRSIVRTLERGPNITRIQECWADWS